MRSLVLHFFFVFFKSYFVIIYFFFVPSVLFSFLLYNILRELFVLEHAARDSLLFYSLLFYSIKMFFWHWPRRSALSRKSALDPRWRQTPFSLPSSLSFFFSLSLFFFIFFLLDLHRISVLTFIWVSNFRIS